jgi:hypothetical protein
MAVEIVKGGLRPVSFEGQVVSPGKMIAEVNRSFESLVGSMEMKKHGWRRAEKTTLGALLRPIRAPGG